MCSPLFKTHESHKLVVYTTYNSCYQLEAKQPCLYTYFIFSEISQTMEDVWSHGFCYDYHFQQQTVNYQTSTIASIVLYADIRREKQAYKKTLKLF